MQKLYNYFPSLYSSTLLKINIIIDFSNDIYIFYTFIYIFLCKKGFVSKKKIQYKTFFPNKNIFSANDVYFVKNTNIFSEKIFFST